MPRQREKEIQRGGLTTLHYADFRAIVVLRFFFTGFFKDLIAGIILAGGGSLILVFFFRSSRDASVLLTSLYRIAFPRLPHSLATPVLRSTYPMR